MREAGKPRPSRKRSRSASPAELARRLYVVARDHPTLFEALKREFVEAPEAVEVVLDRRRRSDPPIDRQWPRKRKAKTAEVVDAEMRRTGWAVVVYG